MTHPVAPAAGTFALALVLTFGFASAGPAQSVAKTPAAADPRAELRTAAQSIDLAVLRVSRPAPTMPGALIRTSSYRIPGGGAMFVLTPRLLPGQRKTAARSDADMQRALRNLEEGVGGVTEAEVRERMTRRLAELRASLETPATPAPSSMPLAELQRQAAVLQRQALEARTEAERQLIAALDQPEVVVPEAPSAPAEPAAVDPAPGPAAALRQAPAPWESWVEPVDEDTRPAARVVLDVRVAVLEAMVAVVRRLPSLEPQEPVTVTVDFLYAGSSPSNVARTLVVRALKADLVSRAAGKLSAEELRARAAFSEY